MSEFTPKNPRSDRLAIRRERENPIMAIQNEMNRMFDNFFSDEFPFPGRLMRRAGEGFFPRVDVSETDTGYKVTAELPGMEEKDIQLRLEKNTLVISGEKKTESEEKGRTWHRVERSYGSFERAIPFDTQLDENKVSASFNKGILTVTLPKAGEALRKSRTIEIKPG